MVTTFGSNIVSAFTGGVPVKAIYAYGEQVWPSSTPPEPGTYYIRWTPSDLSGTFSMSGVTYNLEDYGGYFSFSGDGSITQAAFSNKGLTTLETNATWIGIDAFRNNPLTSINLTGDVNIAPYAFYSCTSLSYAQIQNCTHIDNSAFEGCKLRGMSSLYLPKCTYIGAYVFEIYPDFENVNLPVCSSIGAYAFCAACGSGTLNIPKCEYLATSCFYKAGFKEVNLPVCSYIGGGTFASCSSLSSVTIGYSSVCKLNYRNAFASTPISSGTGSIYVPASLVSAYKTASEWSYYSSRIFPIQE